MAEENKYNILIESGADFVLPFTWYDNNGNPYDLTGATIEGQLRETASSADGYEFVCTHNGAGGRITITLPYEITSDISFSYGVYDVFVNMPGGGRKRPLYGEVEVQDHVTKPHDGAFLYMIGVTDYETLPAQGITDRLYFVYSDRKIYRWNGSNYIATAIGNGIRKIEFVQHVDEFTDKYTLTYDDLTTWDFYVTSKGIDYIEKVGSTGTVRTGIIDQYRIHFNNSTTHDYYVTNGRAFDVKTSYDATQAYEYLDMVKVSGATYVAVQDVPANTEITNTSYWFKIIAPLTIGTVTTVSAETGASASIGGTADAPTLNLSIPRGVTGNESIDDTKGEGDTDYVWSADRSYHLTHDKYFTTTGNFVFEQGYINSLGNTSTSNQDKRGRSPNYVVFNDDEITYIDVVPAEHIYWLVRVYNRADNSFVKSIDNAGDYFQATNHIYIDKSLEYKFVIKNDTDTQFDAETLPANTLTFIAYHCTDKSLTLSGKPADAKVVGDNVSAINSTNLLINTLYPKTEAQKNRICVIDTNYCVRMDYKSGNLSPALHGVRHTLTDSTKLPGIFFGNNSYKLFDVLDKDKNYTLSFDYSCKVSIDCNLNAYKAHGDSLTYSAFTIAPLVANEEASGHYALTFSYLDYNENMFLRISPTGGRVGEFGEGDYVEIRNVMLIEGNYEAAWKPSPLDYIDTQTVDDTVSRNDPSTMEDKLQQLTRRYKEYQGTFKTKILCLLHFSDIHGEKKGLQNVLNFYGYYKNYIDDILHTGDIVRSRYNNGIDFWNEVGGAESILNCIGNHDTSMSSGGTTDWLAISMEQAYQTFYAPFIANWGVVSEEDKTYYYKDYSTENVRLIVLDGCRHADNDQYDWFVNTLASARTNGYHVLCACHIRPGYIIEPYDTPWDDKPVVTDSYPVDTDSSSRSTYAGNLADRYATAVDNFMNDGGNFIAWLHGHVHYKMFYKLGNHPQQLCIGVSAQLLNYDFRNCARVESTKTEDDFYIIGIDTYSKLLRMVKVGVAYDRIMRHTDTLCFDYENHKLIYSN